MGHRKRKACLGKPSSLIFNLSELEQGFWSLHLSVNLSKSEWWCSTKALLLCSLKPVHENFTVFSLKMSLKENLPSCVSFVHNNSCSFLFKSLEGWISSFMYGISAVLAHLAWKSQDSVVLSSQSLPVGLASHSPDPSQVPCSPFSFAPASNTWWLSTSAFSKPEPTSPSI